MSVLVTIVKAWAAEQARGVLRRFSRQVRDGEKITLPWSEPSEPSQPLTARDVQRINEMSKVGPADRAKTRAKLDELDRAMEQRAQPPPRKPRK